MYDEKLVEDSLAFAEEIRARLEGKKAASQMQAQQSIKPQTTQRQTAPTPSVTASQIQAQQSAKAPVTAAPKKQVTPQADVAAMVQPRKSIKPQTAPQMTMTARIAPTSGQVQSSANARVVPKSATVQAQKSPASTPTSVAKQPQVQRSKQPQAASTPQAAPASAPAAAKPQVASASAPAAATLQTASTPAPAAATPQVASAPAPAAATPQTASAPAPAAATPQTASTPAPAAATPQTASTPAPATATPQAASTSAPVSQQQAVKQSTVTAAQMQPQQSAKPKMVSVQSAPAQEAVQQRILPEGQINRQSIPDTAPEKMDASGAAAADIRLQSETGNAEVPKVEAPPKKEHLISVSTSTSRPIRPKTSALDTISEETKSMDAPEEQDHTVEITIKLDVAGIKKKFSDFKKKLAPEERTLEEVNAAMEENRHLQAEKQQEKAESAAEKGAKLAQKTAVAASSMGKKLSGMLHKKPEEAATMEMDGVVNAETEAQAMDGEIVQLEGEAVEENRFAEKLNDLKEVIPQKAGKVTDWVTTVVIIAFCIGIAYFLASFVTTYVAHQTTVEGESMEPTLTDGDSVIIQRLSYYFADPKRYDVVVFPVSYDDGTAKKTYYIKRVIGLPGETVQIIDGSVYINNEKLDDDVYGAAAINEAGIAENPLVLGENQYFVMGDNRNMSTDSRNSYVGLVNKNDIIGEAWLCTWPLNHFGGVKK
jgi:signal peptidase I